MSVKILFQKNKTFMNAVVVFLLMILIGFLPPPTPITPLGMKILGVFVGMLFGWLTMGLIFPSLLGIIMLALVGETPINQIYMEGFGNNIVVLLIFIFVFAAAISEAELGQFIATWLISRKALIGHPWLLTAVFLLSSFLIAAFMNGFGSIIICWGILYSLCGEIGYHQSDNWPRFMIFGIVVASIMGSGAFTFKAIPMAIAGIYATVGGTAEIDFLKFTIVFWILSFFVLLGVLFTGKIYRLDVTLLKSFTPEFLDKSKLKLNRFQKTTLFFLFLLLFILMIPSLLPQAWLLTQSLNKIGPAGLIITIVMLMMVINVDGKPLLDFSKLARHGMLWDPIMLVAVVLPISNALMSESSGINAWMMTTLNPVFANQSEILFTVILLTLSLFFANFINSGIAGALMVFIMISFVPSFDIAPMALMILLIFIDHVTFITPASCPMAALMFSNREWISPKEIYKYSVPVLLWTLITVIIVGFPLSNLLFS